MSFDQGLPETEYKRWMALEWYMYSFFFEEMLKRQRRTNGKFILGRMKRLDRPWVWYIFENVTWIWTSVNFCVQYHFMVYFFLYCTMLLYLIWYLIKTDTKYVVNSTAISYNNSCHLMLHFNRFLVFMKKWGYGPFEM